MCRSEQFEAFPQREADRQISALKVYCPNKDLARGCVWVGELREIDKHLRSCKVACDKCGILVPYKSVGLHYDNDCPCYCHYCGITANRKLISSEHKNNCKKFPVSCPNLCGMENIPMDDIANHKETCPLEVVFCEFHYMGCDGRLARKDMMQHNQEKMAEHLKYLCLETTKQAMINRELQNAKESAEVTTSEISDQVKGLLSSQGEAMEKLTREVAAVKQTAKLFNSLFSPNVLTLVIFAVVIAFLVFHYEKKLAVLESHISDLNNAAYQNVTEINKQLALLEDELKKTAKNFSIQLDTFNDNSKRTLSDTHIELQAVLKRIEQLEDYIQAQARSTQALQRTMRKGLESCENRLRLLYKDLKYKVTLSLDQTIKGIENNAETSLSMMNDLYVELWKLQVFSEMITHGNQIAPIVLTMYNFTEKLKHKVIWRSGSFFAFDEGYQICLVVYANGNIEGEGSHVSVYFYLMKGPYDNKLQKLRYFPMKGKFRIQLLNQLHYNHHHTIVMSLRCSDTIHRIRSGTISKDGCGTHEFIPHCKILESTYVGIHFL